MNKKSLIVVSILMCISFIFGSFATASSAYERVISYINHQVNIVFNGEIFDNEHPAIFHNDRLYIAVSDTSKLAGLELNWDNSSKTLEVASQTNLKSKPIPEQTKDEASINTDNDVDTSSPIKGAENDGLKTIKLDDVNVSFTHQGRIVFPVAELGTIFGVDRILFEIQNNVLQRATLLDKHYNIAVDSVQFEYIHDMAFIDYSYYQTALSKYK